MIADRMLYALIAFAEYTMPEGVQTTAVLLRLIRDCSCRVLQRAFNARLVDVTLWVTLWLNGRRANTTGRRQLRQLRTWEKGCVQQCTNVNS